MSQERNQWLRRIDRSEVVRATRPPVDEETLASAARIVESVRKGGAASVRDYAERFSERRAGEPLVIGRDSMAAALETLPSAQRDVLSRTAARIKAFAQSQRDAVGPIDVEVPGGRAGHDVLPVDAAGCYAPAGRYPLPSSVLMTAVTARVAGCRRVVVASPGSQPVMLAAAALAGADEFLAVGGAHGIAALAYGFEGFQRCDVIVGPGNRWVTAGKQLVSGVVGIDMLAGPSELLVVADESASPSVIARDLLAQAEHDPDASPMLICTTESLLDSVESELSRQLDHLATAQVARIALRNGFACVVASIREACEAANQIAAEHVEILTRDPDSVAQAVTNAGGVFIGQATAEVFGDYGAGPNHTLPTGGTARFRSGLSVMDFLRLRTWLRINEADSGATQFSNDVAELAAIEGLDGHRRSALARE